MLEITIIGISLILTFYFAGTETAFIAVNRVRIEVWRRQNKRSGEIIANFLKKPERFIYTTLIGNNIANIAFASFATLYLNRHIDEKLSWLIITAITVIFGEIIPKTLFRSLADWIIRKVAPLLQIFYYLFKPIIWLVSNVSGVILKIFKQPSGEVNEFFSKKDVEILLRESRDSVDIEKEQGEILDRILALKQIQIREIMVPRAEIVAVSESSNLTNLIKIFETSGFTRIPVYQKDLDHITGVVYLKDLFLHPESLNQIIRKVMFVPETKRSSELLREFKKKNTSIAVVIDEYGGTAGIVTTEDIIEELVGEIVDEFDETVVLCRKVGPKSYRVNARIEPEELKATVGLNLPGGEFETLAGYIINHLGHIPHQNERFEIDGIKFVVTKATRRRLEKVRITLP